MTDVMQAWQSYEQYYNRVKTEVAGFSSTASLVGTQMILDVPTRLEYMRMIRAEADDMLAEARANRRTAKLVFDRIFDRRNELRLIAQDRATASVKVLSKLLTKDRSKYQILVSAANTLAREGKLPVAAGSAADNIRSIPLEELTPDQLDEVFLKAIDKAGGSRKTITPARMRGNGGALLLLTVALAGLDIYLSQDKSFAVSKNISSVAGGAGGAWALAAAGLAVGGPVGGAIGLIVGGIAGAYVGEEAHFQVRGLNSTPEIDRLVRKHHSVVNFDEAGLAKEMHTEFLADLKTVLTTFVHLNEKRSGDADDVARTWIAEAKRVVERHPQGALAQGFAHPLGQNLLSYLHSTLDAGWTSGNEYQLMAWLKTKMTTSR